MAKEVILLVGAAGCGKGTLGKRLEKKGYKIHGMSDILRAQKVVIPTNGDLVPDSVVLPAIKAELDGTNTSCVLDGFPRTVAQAKALFEFGIDIDRVVVISLPLETLIERTRDRRLCKNCREVYTVSKFKRPKVEGICDNCGKELVLVKREEDNEEVVRKRYNSYKDTENDILNVFKEHGVKIVNVDSSKEYSLEKVLS